MAEMGGDTNGRQGTDIQQLSTSELISTKGEKINTQKDDRREHVRHDLPGDPWQTRKQTQDSNNQQDLRLSDFAAGKAADNHVQQVPQYRRLDEHHGPQSYALMQRQDEDAVVDAEQSRYFAFKC